MLKLKFNPNLDYQQDAIKAVTDIFEGQVKTEKKHIFQVIPNKLTLEKDMLLANLQTVQENNNLKKSQDFTTPLNITLEMETGTGKTYVYLRSILELYQKYGFSKYIIVVPTVAIKEGVLKSLSITKDHFKGLYNNLSYEYYEYVSTKLITVRMFAQSSHLQIMIITKDAFNKDKNIIHNSHDRMGDKPISLIQKTNPIVILDEPQKMGGEATQWGIKELNPLIVLRYSATHRDIENLVYKLTPFDAYAKGLVKKIELATVVEESDPNTKKIILENIYSSGVSLKAKLKVFIKQAASVQLKTITVGSGDNLATKSKNPYYDGFIVSEINLGNSYILFSNGLKVFVGQSSVNEDEIVRMMVREIVLEHLEKKRKFNPLGIKTLSLFFIHRVDDYLPVDGWLRKMFEEEYLKATNSNYQEFKTTRPDRVHSGYFSEMKKTSSIENDEKAYELIMKDKEKLLSLDNPVEFIFSHSALREGWDNPNIFNICTLAYSTSDIKKRQEIGRGLRLVVNQQGDRIYDRDINILTVVTNESYQNYVSELQTEFRDDAGESAPPIEHKKKRVSLALKDDAVANKSFLSLWQLLARRAKFVVSMQEEEIVSKCIDEINKIDESSIREIRVRITKTGIDTLLLDDIRGNIVSDRSYETGNAKHLPNIIMLLQADTKLTKKTLLAILQRVSNFDLFFKNSYQYSSLVSSAIKTVTSDLASKDISYLEINDDYGLSLFNKEVQTYEKYLVKLENAKTLYKTNNNGQIDAVIIDPSPSAEGVSQPEKKFAEQADRNDTVKFFFKLPDTYSIETPAGKYTPDWALVVENSDKAQVYFVAETKDTNNISSLRQEEQIKILSARAMFKKIMPEVIFKAPVSEFSDL
ncbi:MAG TPA: DEAD/DEAH box helicase family protein [Candidatus Levybacteria bacterium]|nr:DEAD/DEAH box helicase family protein [Candidatus Levybacteria bacterium]